MRAEQIFPSFDDPFSDLNQFILSLVDFYTAGKINSWEDLEASVKAFFTPARMEQMESLLPGWQKMASYTNGITLVHVMCVFLGMYMMPEFQQLTTEQKDLMKWIILFHDSAKVHIEGKKDAMHAFRSAVLAANTLPVLGFTTTESYPDLIHSWSESTTEAYIANSASEPIPDNQKLPEILAGIEQLYGKDMPATLIIKAALLHISLPVDAMYPTPAPLTEDEIRGFIDDDLFPLLRVMMLADNEGWSMFEPEYRAKQRIDTLAAFEEVKKLISEEEQSRNNMDKKFWVSIAENDSRVPDGHTLENLTEILFSYLGSTDPELRDDIAYVVYANWLKREMYSSETIRSHVDKLLSNLDQGIGETESDTVFLRAFSILLLAEIVHNDNKKPLLERKQIKSILEKGIWYLDAEKDTRGHVPVKGWAHALAHTADLMLVLARNRSIGEAELWSMLAAISSKIVHSSDHIYVHGEDERLASAIIEILRRDLVSLNQLEAWTKSFTKPDAKDWKGAYVDEARNRAFQNTRNLWRSIYLALIPEPEEFPDRDGLLQLFLNTVMDLKLY